MKLTIYHWAGVLAILLVIVGTQLFGNFWYPYFIFVSIAMMSFCVTALFLDKLIPRLKNIGMTGADENKPGRPEIPEMGGIAIVAGFAASALLAISLVALLPLNLVVLLAAVITILTIGYIGIADDLFDLPQWFKAVIPLAAAVPLIVVNAAGSTTVAIPFLGTVQFGVIYTLVLIPLAVAVCSNLTNMLAGFNGMEAGMGAVMFATLALLALNHGSAEMLAISLAMLGALLAFLFFNFYPAKVFPGDVGNFSIGVALASAVIIGNLESAGMILMLPYIADFAVKARNRFPHTHQDLKDGKLYPKDGKVKGLVHVVMKAFGGISEKRLVLFFVGLEIVFALVALALYWK